MNIDQLKEYLKQVEETQLLELLEITSDELVEMFEQRIIEKQDFLEGEVEQLPIPQEQIDEGYEEDEYEENSF